MTGKAPQKRESRNTNANHAEPKPRKRRTFANQKKSNPLKAMILSAGLGTRLMPLTSGIPKALIKVNGIPLLELAIRKLAAEGFGEIIVNIHHHGEQIREFLQFNHFQGVTIEISDETDLLLDTGGGILKARWFLEGNQPFLVYNVDILTSLSLRSMIKSHTESHALATLAVSTRQTSRYFLFNQENLLCGWMDTRTGNTRWTGEPTPHAQPLAFSGIHVINPDIFSLMTETGRFSIVDAYLRLAAAHPIKAFNHNGSAWFDLGKPEQIRMVSDYISTHPELLPQ